MPPRGERKHAAYVLITALSRAKQNGHLGWSRPSLPRRRESGAGDGAVPGGTLGASAVGFLEDALAQTVRSEQQDPEETSRDIVEQLDEITALREQSELYLENDVIDDDAAAHDDLPQFHEPADVAQWYHSVKYFLNFVPKFTLFCLSYD